MQLEDLVAYSVSAALADEVYRAIAAWPTEDRWDVGRQLTRAVDSICANVAEGHGRWQPDDKKRFFVIARGSYVETRHWVARAHARGLLQQTYEAQLDEIGRALNGLIKAQRIRTP